MWKKKEAEAEESGMFFNFLPPRSGVNREHNDKEVALDRTWKEKRYQSMKTSDPVRALCEHWMEPGKKKTKAMSKSPKRKEKQK